MSAGLSRLAGRLPCRAEFPHANGVIIMGKPNSKVVNAIVPGPLEQYAPGFRSWLLEQGYAPLTTPVALVLLALAGWADVLSAVFRGTTIQLAAPDDLRGRLMGVQMAAVTAGPRMGDVEAGAVANAFGATTSVVSGGLACIVGALALGRLLPAFRRQEAPVSQHESELAAAGPAAPGT